MKIGISDNTVHLLKIGHVLQDRLSNFFTLPRIMHETGITYTQIFYRIRHKTAESAMIRVL